MLRYLFCVLLAPVVVLGASQSQARDNTSEQTTVAIRQADARDEGRARVVYASLQAAAHKVCDVPATNDLSVLADSADCRDRALDAAVARLDQPLLNELRREDSAAQADGWRRTRR